MWNSAQLQAPYKEGAVYAVGLQCSPAGLPLAWEGFSAEHGQQEGLSGSLTMACSFWGGSKLEWVGCCP